MKQAFTPADVGHIAHLANIPVTVQEEQTLAQGFTTTMDVIEKLSDLDVGGVIPTSQVTGMENVFREDVVDGSRMFSQEDALQNAPKKHNGYFVVDQVIDYGSE